MRIHRLLFAISVLPLAGCAGHSRAPREPALAACVQRNPCTGGAITGALPEEGADAACVIDSLGHPDWIGRRGELLLLEYGEHGRGDRVRWFYVVDCRALSEARIELTTFAPDRTPPAGSRGEVFEEIARDEAVRRQEIATYRAALLQGPLPPEVSTALEAQTNGAPPGGE